eukprot:1518273-Rhodomonas_salina.2
MGMRYRTEVKWSLRRKWRTVSDQQTGGVGRRVGDRGARTNSGLRSYAYPREKGVPRPRGVAATTVLLSWARYSV